MASADVEPISGSPAFTGGASQQQAHQQQTGHHDQQQTATTLQGPAVIPTTPGPILDSESLSTQPTVVTSSNRTIIHGLVGSGTIQETVKNSLSPLTRVKTNNSKQKEPEKYEQQNEVLTIRSHKADEIREAPAEEDQPPKQTSLLLTKLSPEILQAIIRRCRFSDIVNLRKTCRTLHILAGPDELRILHGREQFRQLLNCHCKICLLHNEDRKKLLRSDSLNVGWPLSSTCIDCALKAGDSRIRVGRKVELANKDQVWVCRWCGRPVAERPAAGSEQFHRLCYRSYHRALAVFFGLGWIQFCLGIVAGALAWRYFRWERLVFGPTVTNFLLLWIDLIFLTFRGNDRNTYPITFGLELIILGLWIAPMYHVATLIHENLGLDIPTEKSTWASMVIFGLNMFFRLMNVIGNFILLYQPDLTRRRRPAVALWKKGLYKIACMFVFFTYPQSVEAKVRDEQLR